MWQIEEMYLGDPFNLVSDFTFTSKSKRISITLVQQDNGFLQPFENKW